MRHNPYKLYSQNWLIILLLLSATAASWTLKADIQAQNLECFGQTATIVGTNKSYNIQATDGDDVIVALGGA